MSRAKAKNQGNPAEAGRPRRVNVRFVLMCALILIVAGGVVGLSVALPEKQEPTPAPATASLPAAIPPLAGSSGIQNPRPYEYDPVTDRHWDPNHGHWHPGQPPANVTSVTPTQQGTTAITKGSGPPPVDLEAALAARAGGTASTGTPDIANPQPWQYDPKTNKHWDPNHGHWHSGQPPAEGNR